MAMVVLIAFNRRTELPARAAGLVEMTAVCPRCRRKQQLPIGDAACSACGLKISIRIEEPCCPECGYLLYQLTSDRCPECGKVVSLES
jgi:ribosomal protein L37E